MSITNVQPKVPVVKKFTELIMEIKQDSQNVTNLRKVIDGIITFNKRFPHDLGWLSLSIFQQSIYQEAEHIVIEPKDSITELTEDYYAVGMKPYGRIILGKYVEKEETDDIFGVFKLTTAEEHIINEVYQSSCIEETRLREEMNNYWELLSQAEQHMLFSNVKKMITHIDPITIYVDQQTFSLFGKYNNLLGDRNSGSEHLFSSDGSVDETKLGESEKVFLYAMNLLHEAGFRSEEFNGLQLNLTNLGRYFNERLGYYQSFGIDKLQGEGVELDGLFNKALRLKQLKQSMQNNFQTYREINGLNFNKREFLYSKAELNNDELKTFQLIKTLLISRTDNKEYFNQFNNSYDLFYAWLQDIEIESTELFDYEELLNEIVALATEYVNADIGMSRGIRDISKIKDITEERISAVEVSEWPVTEFYCCVVPSKKMKDMFKGHPKNLLFTIVNAIAQRMDYNSWHYMPGHFPHDSIPLKRDYYLPPRMPDTAEWSNLHHAGHVLANVLYSIRSPKEIVCKDRAFYGLCDLRFMRQSGEPFREETLAAAIGFTGHIRALNQALLDYLINKKTSIRIQAFNKQWYQERYKEQIN